jgi:hypothetical protein
VSRSVTRFVATLAFATLVLAPLPVLAEETPTRLPLAASDVPAARTNWYGLYMGGAKSGWFRDGFRREGAGGAYVLTQEMHVEAKAMGQAFTMDAVESWEFDATPPFAFRGGARRLTQPQGTQKVTVTRGGKGLVATVEAGGTTRRLEVPAPDLTLADVLTPERWLKKGAKTGDSVSSRFYDLEDLEPDVMRFEVSDVKTTLVDGLPATYYEAEVSLEKKGPLGTWRFDADGILLSLVMGGMIEARREPEEIAKKLEQGGDLFVDNLTRVEGDIAPTFEDVPKVTELVLEATGPGAASLKSAPRQTVVREGGKTIVRLGAVHGTPDEASPDEVAKALAETIDYPTTDPRIVEAAKTAVGDAGTPREKVDRLVKFVREFLEDAACNELVPVVELLDRPKGDCSEHTRLFVTLARAVGVPAREVSGLMYVGDEAHAFGGHAWNEVAIDGTWVAVDATHGETEIDATHIAFAREGRDMELMNSQGPRLSLKVVSVTPRPSPKEEKAEGAKEPEVAPAR